MIATGLPPGVLMRIPTVVQSTFEVLYAKAKSENHYVAFERLSRLGASYGLIDWKAVAADAEELATAPSTLAPAWLLEEIWSLAAEAFERIKEKEGKRRSVARSVEQMLRRREGPGSASANVFWTRKAIGKLRQAGGFKERIEELRQELRGFQDQALDETAQFSIAFDLTVEKRETDKLFGELSLADVLLQLGIFATSPELGELREHARKSREASFLGSMFGSSYMDEEGKIVAETEARSASERITDEQFKEDFARILDMRWHYLVGGYIEPARRTIMRRFPLEERHFRPLVGSSPFVPQGHEFIYSLGFSRFFQGDYASAVHLLVPQLENSLRHVLLPVLHQPDCFQFEFERVLRPLCLDRHRFFSLLEFTHSAGDSFFGGKVIRVQPL